MRVLSYYWRLIRYAAVAQPQIFHILWNNKFDLFDRTLLILYYKLLGKKVVFTAHNVNAGKRDYNDSWLNRFSLRIQYRLVDHILVHTNRMKAELVADFRISKEKVTVIPYGINNAVPNTDLSAAGAKRLLGISSSDKAMLCFGHITPYKGLEYLIFAFTTLSARCSNYRLIIAGKPKGREDYWRQIQHLMARSNICDRIIQRIKEEIIEGKTGFIFKPQDSSDLASKIEKYFKSDLFRNLEIRRPEIKTYANERYSWDKVAAITTAVYSELLRSTEDRGQPPAHRGLPSGLLDQRAGSGPGGRTEDS